MKYLIAILPMLALVACNTSGGGNTGGGTTAPGQVTLGSGTTTITQNGTGYQFTNSSTIAPRQSINHTVTVLVDANGDERGVVASSNTANTIAAYGVVNGAVITGLSGTQMAPAQAQTGGTARYFIETQHINASVPQSVTTRSSSILDVDFGAGTLMTSNPLDLFQFNGTINGTTFSGAVRNNANTDTATPGSIDYLEAGTGTFSGGFYGTDQIAGTWQTTGNVNGNQMGGIFFGEQR